MKVFSKNHKNNKSTPALNNMSLSSSIDVYDKKPKNSNKIKTFKQILT